MSDPKPSPPVPVVGIAVAFAVVIGGSYLYGLSASRAFR